MMKNLLILMTCLASTAVNAQTGINELLVKFCGKSSHNTSQSISIDQVTAIGHHRNGYLQISQEVNDPELQLELIKLARRVDINDGCMEFLDATKIITLKRNDELTAEIEDNVIARVYFDFDRYSLTPESKLIMDSIAARLIRHKDVIHMEGHTDSTGNKKYNYALGLRRADSATQYLVDKGLAESQFEVSSHGEEQPLKDNQTVEGRKTNRRVEVLL